MLKSTSVRFGLFSIPVALLAAFLLATGSANGSSDSDTLTVYAGATLIDGTGAGARQDMAIVVRGERIESVIPVSELSADMRADAKIVDVSGQYVVPGLIDAHVHLATRPSRAGAEAIMRRQLYSGITTVRDMAGDIRALAELSRSSLMKEIPAPDLHYVALMAGESFFDDPRTVASAQGHTPGNVPWMQAITKDTELPVAVGMARGTGATGIKIYADLPADLIGPITAEAHRQHIPVWTHAMVFPAAPMDVVRAGVDVISHVCLLAYHEAGITPERYKDREQPDYDTLNPDGPEMRALYAVMAEEGTVLDATMWIYDRREKALEKDPDAAFPFFCPVDYAGGLIRGAIAAGVPVAAGTDGRTGAEDPFPALHEELELLAGRVGLAPAYVIRSATAFGAMSLGLEDEIGTIEAGKLANLVFVSKDPLADIANLRTVTLTVKRGTGYPRSEYKPIEPGELNEHF
ncbi:MAG: amidohydrolase family protein [Sphingomonadales bacterium]